MLFFFHFYLQCFLLSNAENHEHLRSFRNADCEVTIHNKDQDMQVSKPQTKIVGFPFCGLVFSPLICCFIAKQYRVFDKICKHEFLEKFECTECISSILEQKLECLNRTQTSLNFGFIIQWQHMITLFFYFKTSRTFLFKLHFTFLINALNVVKTWCLWTNY